MKLKVVIVEKEDSVRESLRWYLADEGHEVICTPNIKELRNILPCPQTCSHIERCADIYLIHKTMIGGKTGHDFVRDQIKAGCKVSPPNMAIISSATEESDFAKARELGYRVIQKPVRFDQIDDMLEDVKMCIPLKD